MYSSVSQGPVLRSRQEISVFYKVLYLSETARSLGSPEQSDHAINTYSTKVEKEALTAGEDASKESECHHVPYRACLLRQGHLQLPVLCWVLFNLDSTRRPKI